MRVESNLIAFLPLLAAVVNAASCANYDDNMRPWLSGHQQDLWNLRQRMCGNNECGSQQICTLSYYSKDGNANIYRKDVQSNFPNCWDATSNIITQCSRNWWKNGWWQLGDEFYQVNVSPNFEFKRDLGADENAPADGISAPAE